MRVSNEGYATSSFLIFSEPENGNSDGLGLQMDGLDDPIGVFLSGANQAGTPGEASYLTLEVKRGPRLNRYKPVSLYIQSKVCIVPVALC